jgi:hypothetical protein
VESSFGLDKGEARGLVQRVERLLVARQIAEGGLGEMEQVDLVILLIEASHTDVGWGEGEDLDDGERNLRHGCLKGAHT